MTTYDEAYASFTTALKTVVAANSVAIIGLVPEIRYFNNEAPGIPTNWFVRFVMTPVADKQSSFRQTDGQRFVANGIVALQVFAPRKNRDAYQKLRKYSMMLQHRFRNSVDCIVTLNVRINDLPAEDAFWRQVVIAEYRYDEIQVG